MISLTFGEQVKIVLSRKGMTIKELAEQIEERTGKKMSRQNLTQRLGRDNFQEQDMRMIAEILGCSFQLSILATQEAAERASVIEEILPTAGEIGRLEASKERRAARAEAKKRDAEERDLTIGEIVDMMQSTANIEENAAEKPGAEPVNTAEIPESVSADAGEAEAASTQAAKSEDAAEVSVSAEKESGAVEETAGEQAESAKQNESSETAKVTIGEAEAVKEESAQGEAESEPQTNEREVYQAEPESAKVQEEPAEATAEEPEQSRAEANGSKPERQAADTAPRAAQEKKGGFWSKWEKPKKKEEPTDFQPIRRRVDEDEDREKGDVNPYTGREYQSNSVRMHPKRIGYVQVYDRKEHKWTDMTEWAFLGFEERKKAAMGKDYEPPIYLD